MTWGFVAMMVGVLLRLLEPWPVKMVIDSVSRSLGATIKRPGPTMEASLETMLLCGGAIVVISILRAIANYWSAIAFATIGSRSQPICGPKPSATCRACPCGTTRGPRPATPSSAS